MKRYIHFSNWHESLTEEQKKRFFFLQTAFILKSQNHFVNLLEKNNLKLSNNISIDELISQATENLTAVDLDCDWLEVRFHLNEIKRKITSGEVPNNYGLYADKNIFEREVRVLLFNVLTSSGLLGEYINERTTAAENVMSLRDPDKAADLIARLRGNLRDFDKVTSLIANFRMLVFLATRKSEKDWKELYNDLINGHYIADCSLSDFNLVMNEHSLPQGKDKIKWIGPRYTGFWFGKFAGFDVKTLNKLFIPSNGKPFRNNDNTICKIEFEQLMLRYFPKIQ
jgi:hypothetical protein